MVTRSMDVGTGGTWRTYPSTLQKLGQRAPFRITWLLSFKTLKIQKSIEKCTFPEISEDLSFEISRWSMPADPLADLHCLTPHNVCSFLL